jgi:hypothetical protein
MDDDTKLWSVDRSWAQYRGNSDGNLAASDQTKLHVDRGDTTAKCSPRVFLNSMPGDADAGTVAEWRGDDRVCRRCVRESNDSTNGAAT